MKWLKSVVVEKQVSEVMQILQTVFGHRFDSVVLQVTENSSNNRLLTTTACGRHYRRLSRAIPANWCSVRFWIKLSFRKLSKSRPIKESVTAREGQWRPHRSVRSERCLKGMAFSSWIRLKLRSKMRVSAAIVGTDSRPELEQLVDGSTQTQDSTQKASGADPTVEWRHRIPMRDTEVTIASIASSLR